MLLCKGAGQNRGGGCASIGAHHHQARKFELDVLHPFLPPRGFYYRVVPICLDQLYIHCPSRHFCLFYQSVKVPVCLNCHRMSVVPAPARSVNSIVVRSPPGIRANARVMEGGFHVLNSCAPSAHFVNPVKHLLVEGFAIQSSVSKWPCRHRYWPGTTRPNFQCLGNARSDSHLGKFRDHRLSACLQTGSRTCYVDRSLGKCKKQVQRVC